MEIKCECGKVHVIEEQKKQVSDLRSQQSRINGSKSQGRPKKTQKTQLETEELNFNSIVQVNTKKELYIKQKQTDLILVYMLQGNKITSLEALKKFGCLRLGGRIYDLKKQYKNIYEIKSKLIKVDNKHIAQYWLGLDKK